MSRIGKTNIKTKTKAKAKAKSRDSRVYADFNQLVSFRHLARGFHFRVGQPRQSILAGRHASKLRGRGLNFEELRHYQRGDDVRSIDWKVSQRSGRPYVRTYNEEKERNVYLCIDQCPSMFFGSESEMKSVTAAKVAAFSAWRALADHDRVGAIIFNDHEVTICKPQRNLDSALQLLRTLEQFNHQLSVNMQPTPGGSGINNACRQLARMQLKDALIIFISDWRGCSEQAFKQVKQLSLHNDVIGVWVFDKMEQEIALLPGFMASDGQKQLHIRQSNSELHNKFKQGFSQKETKLRQALQHLSLPVLTINTGGDVLKQLLNQLGGE